MAADDPRERVRRPLLHARGAAADARAGRRARRQRQLGRRALRARGLGRLQPDQVRRRRLLGGAAPGGGRDRRARHPDRAGRRRRPSCPATTARRSSSRWRSASPASRRCAEDIAAAILYAIGQPPTSASTRCSCAPSGQALATGSPRSASRRCCRSSRWSRGTPCGPRRTSSTACCRVVDRGGASRRSSTATVEAAVRSVVTSYHLRVDRDVAGLVLCRAARRSRARPRSTPRSRPRTAPRGWCRRLRRPSPRGRRSRPPARRRLLRPCPSRAPAGDVRLSGVDRVRHRCSSLSLFAVRAWIGCEPVAIGVGGAAPADRRAARRRRDRPAASCGRRRSARAASPPSRAARRGSRCRGRRARAPRAPGSRW